MAISVDPTSGPPGTVVHIEVTGCNDPTGLNHALSFNNFPDNPQHFDGKSVRLIESTQNGQRLSAEYTVLPSDNRARVAKFIVQCSDGTAATDFTVDTH